MAGREALEVRVGTVLWGYLPSIFHGFYAPENIMDHLQLLVDVEVRTLLRTATRLEDRQFYVVEPPRSLTTIGSQMSEHG
jgi:hypothetical protein